MGNFENIFMILSWTLWQSMIYVRNGISTSSILIRSNAILNEVKKSYVSVHGDTLNYN